MARAPVMVHKHGLEATGHSWLLATADLDLQDPLSVHLTGYRIPTEKNQKQGRCPRLKASLFCLNIPCECFNSYGYT